MFVFSKTNSRQENRSKLSFPPRIITKDSLEHFLSICGEKLSKGFLKFCKIISNQILGEIVVSNLLPGNGLFLLVVLITSNNRPGHGSNTTREKVSFRNDSPGQ